MSLTNRAKGSDAAENMCRHATLFKDDPTKNVF